MSSSDFICGHFYKGQGDHHPTWLYCLRKHTIHSESPSGTSHQSRVTRQSTSPGNSHRSPVTIHWSLSIETPGRGHGFTGCRSVSTDLQIPGTRHWHQSPGQLTFISHRSIKTPVTRHQSPSFKH